MRYRSVFDSNNAHEYNQGQQRSIVDGTFKFDNEGKYGVTFHLSSGDYFNWAYADFIGGGASDAAVLQQSKLTPPQRSLVPFLFTHDGLNRYVRTSGGWALRMRRLYIHAEVAPGFEFQYGSLDINRGAGTEITTYDNDGYISGGRMIVRKPSLFFFDEASVTYAYFGDIFTPDFFNRGESLAKSDYHQFLVAKHLGTRLQASVDFTAQNGSHTMREAALVNTRELKAVDRVRFETYQRPNRTFYPGHMIGLAGGNGFALTADKKLNSRFRVEAGLANIDIRYTVLTQVGASSLIGFAVNGDQYGLGNRFFVRPTIALTPYLELSGFYTHTYSSIPDPFVLIWNKQALNAGINFDVKKLLFPK